MLDLRSRFSRFLQSDPTRLHFAAHSHHPWPDVTRDAQVRAWDDAARWIDDKWQTILGPVLDEFRAHVAGHLGLPHPSTIAIAPNTHECLMRLLSCFPAGRRLRILTTDGEFHSFSRQIARLEEDDLVAVTRVAVEPFDSFETRLLARGSDHDLIFVSQVFFDTGFAMDIDRLREVPGDAMIVIDGYHGFMARPTDLSRLASRAFYMAGGYKYAMAGEGACFLHCPPGLAPRPRDTGWFAAFGNLSGVQMGQVAYPEDGWRFMGSTFDPSGLYRFNAVMRWLAEEGIAVGAIHDHALALQDRFLALAPARLGPPSASLPTRSCRGNFLSLGRPDADAVHRRLKALNIVTDTRGTRLRIGFGLYQTAETVSELFERLETRA
ncbi:MAG: aminotransferase class V-fold PLP-dependent enzyme [Microvirga sp.]